MPPASANKRSAHSSLTAELESEFLDQVSCFETLRAYAGRIFCLKEHLNRLGESSRGIGNTLPLSERELGSWLEALIEESGHPDARVRCSIHWSQDRKCVVTAVVFPFSSYPSKLYEEGVSLVTGVNRRSLLKAQDPQLKASQFVSGVLAHLDSRDRKAHEVIFFGHAGTVAEGTISNLFIVKEKTLLTPSVSSGILRGVTRGVVAELAPRRGLPLVETFLTRHDIYNADECFLTNTSSEILPVVAMDARKIGAGIPGPLTRTLADDFKKYVRERLDKK